MSESLKRKQSSYSQFRKKNSLSKNNLHRSMVQIDSSISIIADQKTQQLLSIQNELQSMVRNRSLSSKPSAKNIGNQCLKLAISKTLQTPQSSNSQFHLSRRNSISMLNPVESGQKSNRSIHFHHFNETFQIIEESEVHNQEDNLNGIQNKETDHKIAAKLIQAKPQKSNVLKRKQTGHLTMTHKPETKATLKDLDQMQKRLESAKKGKKIQIAGQNKKIVKKSDPLTTSNIPSQKTQRRLHKTVSQALILTEPSAKFRNMEVKQKQSITPKPILKKKFPLQQQISIKPEKQLAKQPISLIPTKMVNLQQKQKLLKEFDMIKESIKNSQICCDNIGTIRNMLKNIEGLIN